MESGENFTTVGIKVSPVIRKYLIEQGYIYIGETRCKVVDRIDLKQCFKCQRVGHISSQCKSSTVCMGIFDELYPGVKKFKVQDGNFLI